MATHVCTLVLVYCACDMDHESGMNKVNIIQLNTHTILNVCYVCRLLQSCRQKTHLHRLNSYNWPFEGKHNADMALSENAFDIPALSDVSVSLAQLSGILP